MTLTARIRAPDHIPAPTVAPRIYIMKMLKIARAFVLLIVVLNSFPISLFAQPETEDNEIPVLIKEGIQYFNLGNPGALRIASEKFSALLEKCRKAEIDEIKQCEALALGFLGQISLREGENEKALDFLNQARLAFQAIKSRDERLNNFEHQILLGLGSGYLAVGDGEKAVQYFNELLALTIKRNEVSGQATVLAYIGNAYQRLKQKDNALAKYRESLKIFQDEKAKFPGAPVFHEWEIAVLDSIAQLHQEYGEITESLAYNKKILEIHKSRNHLKNAVITLNIMHMISAAAGRATEAFRYLDEAVAISQSLGDKNLEAYILGFAVSTNYAEGEVTKAIEISRRILPITQQQGNLPEQARLLAFIGGIYLHLGNYPEAINYYERAIPVYQSEGCRKSEIKFAPATANYCRQGETIAVTGLGKALNATGRKEDALRILEAELDKIESEPNLQTNSDDQHKGMLLYVIGQMYFETNQNEKAIRYFSRALPLINNRNVRAKSLVISDIGRVQANSENKAEALLSYNQALLHLTPFVKNLKKGKEAAAGYTLSGLMLFYRFENPKAAIFFGKKAVDAYQRNRQEIKQFEIETQKTFLKSIEFTYRTLVELLIEQNRLGEAQQILNSFKDQQFFDFNRAAEKPFQPLSPTLRETDLAARYEKASEAVSKADFEIEEIKRKIANRQPTTEEAAQLRKAENNLKTVSDEFTAVLKQAETDFSKPADEKDKAGDISDLRQMQAALRDISQSTGQKTVAVYQLIGEENFHLLLITPEDIKKISAPAKNANLQKRALKFWSLLQSPAYDPTKLGKELYDTIFKPLEKELPADTKTILWSLDGNLRYIPMAALYDGNAYLIERFNHVNFTRADRERIIRATKSAWTATGFGSVAAQTVELLGDKIFFKSLPGVGEELRLLFKKKNITGALFEGDTFQDADFNKTNFLAAMRQKRPLVHIASHFAFRAGDEARSFLLMGDGSIMTLAEMKQQKDLFQGVELLTLSACNTAAQREGSGREIDAFSELAQRLGADAVLATLWAVADNSTPALMHQFYDLKVNRNLSKAEALRQAQLALLRGDLEVKPAPAAQTPSPPVEIVIVRTAEDKKQEKENTRGDKVYLDGQDAQEFVVNTAKPYAHPYYWSPFILFGNWR